MRKLHAIGICLLAAAVLCTALVGLRALLQKSGISTRTQVGATGTLVVFVDNPSCAATAGTACHSAANACGQTNAGAVLCDGTCSSSAPPDSQCPAAKGGGGGGGGIIAVQPATVTFEGLAYPGSTVVLLKDGQIALTTQADANAQFTLELADIMPNSYVFSLYGIDQNGNRSVPLSYSLTLPSNGYTRIGGISIASSLGAEKSKVSQSGAASGPEVAQHDIISLGSSPYRLDQYSVSDMTVRAAEGQRDTENLRHLRLLRLYQEIVLAAMLILAGAWGYRILRRRVSKRNGDVDTI